MLRVVRNHRNAVYAARPEAYENLSVLPVPIDAAVCEPGLLAAAKEDADRALALGEQHGYRNAQATVLAPTGTIGLLMDCDTTGIEPDFALVKYKKLAGGGYFKIVNQSVPPALKKLGYTPPQIQEIVAYVTGTNTLLAAPNVTPQAARARPHRRSISRSRDDALPRHLDLDQRSRGRVIGEDTYERLGITRGAARGRLRRSSGDRLHEGRDRRGATRSSAA